MKSLEVGVGKIKPVVIQGSPLYFITMKSLEVGFERVKTVVR